MSLQMLVVLKIPYDSKDVKLFKGFYFNHATPIPLFGESIYEYVGTYLNL